MKILFINAYDNVGGAALAATRLSKGLEKRYTTENCSLVGQKHSDEPAVFGTRSHRIRAVESLKTSAEIVVDAVFNKLGLQYQYFPFSSRFILKKARSFDPDIISLHNTHGGYFKTSLLRRLSKIAPVYWTLHDMWSFTANAAHTFGDESWKLLRSGRHEKDVYPYIGINSGKWLLKQKRRIYSKSDIHVIAPSNWLFSLAKDSPVFAGKSITRIPHGVDLDVFRVNDQGSCRKAFGIREDARVLMFSSADDLWRSHWRGGELLVEILTSIDSKANRPIDVLVLGKGRLPVASELKNVDIRRIGYVGNEHISAALLCAADVFINAARAESLGLAMIEAIACGTPCIAFSVGGCGDVIKNDVSGYLIDSFDSEAFAAKTVELLGNRSKLKELSQTSRKWAEDHFSLMDMVESYHELFYASLAGKARPRNS